MLGIAEIISGKDASKLAKIWDPQFSSKITSQLASQEDFRWTIKMRAAPGEEQPTPMQFWLFIIRLKSTRTRSFCQISSHSKNNCMGIVVRQKDHLRHKIMMTMIIPPFYSKKELKKIGG